MSFQFFLVSFFSDVFCYFWYGMGLKPAAYEFETLVLECSGVPYILWWCLMVFDV